MFFSIIVTSCLQYSETVDAVADGLIALCLDKMDMEKQENILSGTFNLLKINTSLEVQSMILNGSYLLISVQNGWNLLLSLNCHFSLPY